MTYEDLPSSIRRLVGSLVREFCPRRAIVFGSWARGEARPGSDIDLLLVVDSTYVPAFRVEVAQWVRRHSVLADVVVVSEAEYERGRTSSDTFLHVVAQTGVDLDVKLIRATTG